MARKKETDYFEAFVGGVNSACAAADMLCTVFDHYEPEALPGHIEAMHKIEHSADIEKHGTMEQLVRVMDKCRELDFFEISGEDINQPRQSFICMKQRDEAFRHLSDNTWALVGHENAATADPEESIYSDKIKKEYPGLKERVAHFKEIGLQYKK